MLNQLSSNHLKYKTLNLIEVSKNALKGNFEYFSFLQKRSKICPVLKSNAYGHGLKLIGKFVDQEINPEFICVDSLYEAYELEKVGVRRKILVMGYTFPENFKYRKINFHLPVFDLETLEVLNKYQPGVSVHIKVDTGMNRLGIKENEVEIFMRSLKKFNRIKVVGIYSHLSSVDDVDADEFTQIQIDKFKRITRYFENNGFSFQYKHINATAGAIRFPDKEFNLSRVGLGFYGISPFPAGSLFDRSLQNKMKLHGLKPVVSSPLEDFRIHSRESLGLLRRRIKPALRLITHICQLKEIGKGETVSYGQTFKAKERMKIAILPLGYYDGIDRRLSNKGKVRIGDVYCPIIGLVCMNVTVVDVSAVKKPYVGQEAIVFDNQQNCLNSIKNTASLIGSIPYEVLVNLSETTRRVLV